MFVPVRVESSVCTLATVAEKEILANVKGKLNGRGVSGSSVIMLWKYRE